MLKALTSLAAPPLCGICGAPCEPRDRICAGCRRELARLRPVRSALPGGLEVISSAPYEGIAREIVTKMKYSARLTLAEVAAERMVHAWGAARCGWFVAVPPAPSRRRARGYDNAHALAQLVARGTPGSQVSSCLERDDGPRQVGRARADRLADPPRIRPLGARVRLPAGHLCLVDDVVTTGATLQACAATLRGAGATTVQALTFARAESLGETPLAA